jgi:uncharacterized membrane protein YvbJ
MKFSFITIFLLVSCLFLFFDNISAENFSSRRRRTKELEEKINKLDDATKQRIYAMKASGMPRDAIAEKISYVAGGKGTAKRIVDALHDEPPKKKTPNFKAPPQQQKRTATTAAGSATSKTVPNTNKFAGGRR